MPRLRSLPTLAPAAAGRNAMRARRGDASCSTLAAMAVATAFATALGSADTFVLPVGAELPESRATDYLGLTPQDTNRVLRLKSTQFIPDDGEINWNVFVPDEDASTVKSLAVEIRGLYHHYASDLRIKLRHEGVTSTLTDGGGGAYQLGEPDDYRHPNVAGPDFPDPTGTGFTYTWEDDMGENLALDKLAVQSSTSFGGGAWRANDGNTNGFYSSLSVTHTGGPPSRLERDVEPYWEVDLNTTTANLNTTIGTVRVWNRQQEPNVDEVQAVTATSLGTVAGSFTLDVTHLGETQTTGSIAVNAVPEIRDEDQDSTSAGIGAGESVQAKIQALTNIGNVRVRRSDPDPNGGYTWTVTFTSEPGDLDQMAVNSNDITTANPSVTIETLRDGNSNVFYNYESEVVKITGQLFPAWVMLFTETPGNVSLAQAKLNATWKRRITEDQRETTLVLPVNTTGRYVRVQTESVVEDLSLAEVQVFSKRASMFSVYEGGTPLPASTYQPEKSLVEAFQTMDTTGHWTLSIEDLAAAAVVEGTSSRPEVGVSGRGAFDSWALTITDANDVVTRYEPDMSAVIKTLPVYGTLYKYNQSTGGVGVAIDSVVGQTRYLSECYNNCVPQFGVGCPFSTSEDGSVAVATNRLLPHIHDMSVVYVPNEDWLGSDHFTYAILLGTVESARGTITVDTRKCRVRTDCINEMTGDFSVVRRGV